MRIGRVARIFISVENRQNSEDFVGVENSGNLVVVENSEDFVGVKNSKDFL